MGQPQAAIDRHFSKIIAFFKKAFPASQGKFYTARSTKETIIYLTLASVNNEGKNAFVVSNTWSEAHYNTCYAFIELKEWQKAKYALEQALQLAPRNSRYLAELAYVYQLEKNWQKALKLYEKAESDADISPPESQSQELRRAKRGIGFILIELRQFAAARKKYYEC
ncbi:MAG: tetratricopeptide repeat protein, partial [Gallionellaceae bacterium]|nr:tetratricopeptide repeat protein [Gallionellaceae bacterium]